MRDSYETFLVFLFNVKTSELVTTHCSDNKELAYLMLSLKGDDWMVTKIDIILGWVPCKELMNEFNAKEDLNTGQDKDEPGDLI